LFKNFLLLSEYKIFLDKIIVQKFYNNYLLKLIILNKYNEFDKCKINKIKEIIFEENEMHNTLIEPNTLLIIGIIEKSIF